MGARTRLYDTGWADDADPLAHCAVQRNPQALLHRMTQVDWHGPFAGE
ncbi:hypothetical protein IM511_11925 [Erythrobacteraceae bacterium E2-1 Yellow Sea]|nr:hypothetical protein [Erythrobacteraceae bacterium E2-1 Yellow Sea]